MLARLEDENRAVRAELDLVLSSKAFRLVSILGASAVDLRSTGWLLAGWKPASAAHGLWCNFLRTERLLGSIAPIPRAGTPEAQAPRPRGLVSCGSPANAGRRCGARPIRLHVPHDRRPARAASRILRDHAPGVGCERRRPRISRDHARRVSGRPVGALRIPTAAAGDVLARPAVASDRNRAAVRRVRRNHRHAGSPIDGSLAAGRLGGLGRPRTGVASDGSRADAPGARRLPAPSMVRAQRHSRIRDRTPACRGSGGRIRPMGRAPRAR